MEQSTAQSPYCTCSQMENGIYVFKFLANGRPTIDALIAQIERIYVENAESPLLRFLIDTNHCNVSVSYFLQRSGEMRKRHPTAPHERSAVLVDDSALYAIISHMVRLLRVPITTRQFNVNQRDEAIRWLLTAEPR
jgi:hypothetical protein